MANIEYKSSSSTSDFEKKTLIRDEFIDCSVCSLILVDTTEFELALIEGNSTSGKYCLSYLDSGNKKVHAHA